MKVFESIIEKYVRTKVKVESNAVWFQLWKQYYGCYFSQLGSFRRNNWEKIRNSGWHLCTWR